MKTKLLLITVLTSFLATGCPEPRIPLGFPPYLRVKLPRVSTYITHFKMRFAVFNFIDQTHAAGELVKILPDMLTTELFNTGRFEIYDRGQLRDRSGEEIEKLMAKMKSRWSVDSFVHGSITGLSPDRKKLSVDIRIISSRGDLVVFAKSFQISYEGRLNLVASRGDIVKIAKTIWEAFPKVADGKIVDLTPQHVVVSRGGRH